MTTITVSRSSIRQSGTAPAQVNASALGFHGKQWPTMITVEGPGQPAENFVFKSEATLPGEGLLGQHFETKTGALLFVHNL